MRTVFSFSRSTSIILNGVNRGSFSKSEKPRSIPDKLVSRKSTIKTNSSKTTGSAKIDYVNYDFAVSALFVPEVARSSTWKKSKEDWVKMGSEGFPGACFQNLARASEVPPARAAEPGAPPLAGRGYPQGPRSRKYVFSPPHISEPDFSLCRPWTNESNGGRGGGHC